MQCHLGKIEAIAIRTSKRLVRECVFSAGVQWLLLTPDDIARPPQDVHFYLTHGFQLFQIAVFYEAPSGRINTMHTVLFVQGDLRFGLQWLLFFPDDIARPPLVALSSSACVAVFYEAHLKDSCGALRSVCIHYHCEIFCDFSVAYKSPGHNDRRHHHTRPPIVLDETPHRVNQHTNTSCVLYLCAKLRKFFCHLRTFGSL